jgi:hypothetical protein
VPDWDGIKATAWNFTYQLTTFSYFLPFPRHFLRRKLRRVCESGSNRTTLQPASMRGVVRKVGSMRLRHSMWDPKKRSALHHGVTPIVDYLWMFTASRRKSVGTHQSGIGQSPDNRTSGSPFIGRKQRAKAKKKQNDRIA